MHRLGTEPFEVATRSLEQRTLEVERLPAVRVVELGVLVLVNNGRTLDPPRRGR